MNTDSGAYCGWASPHTRAQARSLFLLLLPAWKGHVMTDHEPEGFDITKLPEAEKRVYTADLDALEALIVEGLPPLEMQAAAWVLVQRVRGLHDDLRRVARQRS